MKIPVLETDRLLIRPLVESDLRAVFELIDCDAFGNADPHDDIAKSRRDDWLRWTILGYKQQTQLGKPPYGERAVITTSDDRLVGLCGLVPSFGPFVRLLDGDDKDDNSPEIGLFYAVSSRYRRNGFATEAAAALIDFTFENLRPTRIVATTEFDNAASIGVMQRLGMTIHENSDGAPQIVGCLVRNA